LELAEAGARSAWWRARTGIAAIGFAPVAAFHVLREHRGHAFGALPGLLLLACPLMHLFMHHGRGRHHAAGEASSNAASRR
jgi:hypothetical protein